MFDGTTNLTGQAKAVSDFVVDGTLVATAALDVSGELIVDGDCSGAQFVSAYVSFKGATGPILQSYNVASVAHEAQAIGVFFSLMHLPNATYCTLCTLKTSLRVLSLIRLQLNVSAKKQLVRK